MNTTYHIRYNIKYSILHLQKLEADLSTAHETEANIDEKPKLLADLNRIQAIRKQIRDLEVNDTRFGMKGGIQ